MNSCELIVLIALSVGMKERISKKPTDHSHRHTALRLPLRGSAFGAFDIRPVLTVFLIVAGLLLVHLASRVAVQLVSLPSLHLVQVTSNKRMLFLLADVSIKSPTPPYNTRQFLTCTIAWGMYRQDSHDQKYG